mgnify:CR=1 FL=1
MINYTSFFRSFTEVLVSIGNRAKKLRLRRNFTQSELAQRSGIGVATIHRFEKTGHIAIENALRIAVALGAEGAFEKLFELPQFASIDDALQSQPSSGSERKRARKSAIKGLHK